MNINDFIVQADDCDLETIFQRQIELEEKYLDIEKANGVHNPYPQANLDIVRDQLFIKDLAWRVTEELAEAIDAAFDQEKGLASDHAREEIADAFHFLVAIAIYSGYRHANELFDPELGEPLEHIFNTQLARTSLVPEAFVRFIRDLGMLCHTLKNKPWKQSHMITDRKEYKSRLQVCFRSYAVFCLSVGIAKQTLFSLYFRKSEVNKFRQRSNY